MTARITNSKISFSLLMSATHNLFQRRSQRLDLLARARLGDAKEHGVAQSGIMVGSEIVVATNNA